MAVRFWEDRQLNFPCKDCHDRTVGCHSTCQKYMTAKVDHQKKADIVRDLYNKDDMLDEFKNRTIRKIKKRCNRR